LMQPVAIPPLDPNSTTPKNNETPSSPTETKSGLWRPLLIGNRMRTTSEDSVDAFDAFPAPGSMLDDSEETGRKRKMSITDMFLGSTGRRHSVDSMGSTAAEEKGPITDNPKFKEFLKRHRQLVDDQA